eukprot:603718-Prorocentrum_minimum.AAC.6
MSTATYPQQGDDRGLVLPPARQLYVVALRVLQDDVFQGEISRGCERGGRVQPGPRNGRRSLHQVQLTRGGVARGQSGGASRDRRGFRVVP